MKTAEMGVLIKFPSKQRQDRHLPVVFRSGDVQDKNLKISLHLHSSPLSVLGMLFKTLLLHTAPPPPPSPAYFLQKDHWDLFAKDFWVALGLKPTAFPQESISFSDCGV